jgi:hypothetical protein
VSLHKLGRNEEALAILKEAAEKWIGFHKELKNDILKVESALAKL